MKQYITIITIACSFFITNAYANSKPHQISNQQLKEQCGIGASDLKTQVACVKSFANKGQEKAQLTLGLLYFTGSGVDKNLTIGLKWWLKAGSYGNSQTEYNIGLLLFKGSYGIKKDYKQAFKWWKKSADQNFAPAQNALGTLYQQGYGVKKDLRQSAIYYTKASRQRYPEAQNNIGVMYMKGIGVKQDDKIAFKVLLQSAYGGFSLGAYNVGYMYANGRGVAKSLIRAYAWWMVAVNSGARNLKQDDFNTLAKNFSKNQLEQAKMLAGTIERQIQKNLTSKNYQQQQKQSQKQIQRQKIQQNKPTKDLDINSDYEEPYDG